MTQKRILIFGISTCAKNIYNFIKKYNLFEIIGFAIDPEYRSIDSYCGLPVFDINQIDSFFSKKDDFIFVAMQWNRLNRERRDIFERLKSQGFKFANLVSPNSIVNGTLEGGNCWICDDVIIDFGSIIHENVFVKIKAFIADDVEIQAHSFIGASSTIGGGSKIGKQSFVGLGAVVFDNVLVGNKCIVGATVSLKRNLPDFSVAKTSSEQSVIRTYGEESIETKLMFQKNVR